MRKKIQFYKLDKLLLLAPILIFGIGLLSIYSTSVKAGQPLFNQPFVVKQILWMVIGVLLVFLIVRVPYFKLIDFAWPVYFVCLFLLLAVLFTPARLGAHRWINIGGFNLQPSELAKISIILVLANFFANNRTEYISREKMLIPFMAVGFPFLLILKEPDLGTGLTLIPILLAMLYLWGFKPKYILMLCLAVALVSPVLFHFLKEYQKARLLVFINPNMDPLGAGYTIIQSKIAIGSGGLWGRGFLGGSQNQLNFVPENHTDFIFAVIAEEGGFIASLLVLALFWLIVYRGYQIAAETSDRFGCQLACGLTTLLGLQAIINFGMTMGLLPVVGVPLPLVSYGGSSVIVTMVAIGMLINIKIHRPVF